MCSLGQMDLGYSCSMLQKTRKRSMKKQKREPEDPVPNILTTIPFK